METDKEFYQLFKSNPGLLSDLLDLEVEDYHFTCETFKGIKREVDGVYSHPGKKQAWVIEFHGYPHKKKEMDIYTATFAGMVFFKRGNRDKNVGGIIIFLDPAHDLEVQPWYDIRQANLSCFQVYYLKELIQKLADRDPQNVLLDVFFPLLVDQKEQLNREVVVHYERIQKAGLEPEKRYGIESVFTSWLLARLERKEVVEMLSQMSSLENTPAAEYFRDQVRSELQPRIEKLEAERRLSNIIADIRGIEGQIQLIKRILGKGRITKDEYNEELEPLQIEMGKLKKRLEDLAGMDQT